MAEEIVAKDRDRLSKIAKEIVFNSDRPLKERYSALQVLITDVTDKINKLQYGLRRLQACDKSFKDEALQNHKLQRMATFTSKWQDKPPCQEMLDEMNSISKPNHCYKFAGIDVIEEDCRMCSKRSCESEATSPENFEQLLGNLAVFATDPIVTDEIDTTENGDDVNDGDK